MAFDRLRSGFIKKTFPLWQALGVHVTPNHFYEPVPDTRTLRDDLWAKPSALVGLRMNEERQLALLDDFIQRYKDEYDRFPDDPTADPTQFYLNNTLFLGVDAEVLYSMVRHFRPGKIVEVGSGFSTLLAAQAIRRNRDEDPAYRGELIAIDPYRPRILRGNLPELSRLIQKPVQQIDLAELTDLAPNDILFIDSSHVLRIGSDVHYEYLELLPRLPSGVLIHVHDIFFPAEYPREWVLGKHRFWNEQYLLQAFLAFNEAFEILWAGSYLHHRHPERLAAAFRSYRPDENWQGRRWRPGSLWMRRVR